MSAVVMTSIIRLGLIKPRGGGGGSALLLLLLKPVNGCTSNQNYVLTRHIGVFTRQDVRHVQQQQQQQQRASFYGTSATSGHRWTMPAAHLVDVQRCWWCPNAPVRHFVSRTPVADKNTAPKDGSSDSQADDKEPEVDKEEAVEAEEPKKLTTVQRLKKMFKEYWYVLLPVHVGTSVIWLGAFYYLAKCGIDIVPMLEYLGAGEVVLKPLRTTGAGYWAVAYALYKLSSPLRYGVTLGGTTFSIKYLNRWGLIRPMPTADQMRVMFREKRLQLKSRRAQALAKINVKRKSTTTKSE